MHLQSSYQRAFFFAAQKHQQAGNWVNGTTDVPYAVHIGNVTMEVMMAHANTPSFDLEFAVQVALLHDVLEDTHCTEEELLNHFGEAVTNGVKALTKDKGMGKKGAMEDSLNRIICCSPEVGMVKLADRITNLQPPPSHWKPEKIKEYYQEGVWIHSRLGHLNPALSDRLKSQLDAYTLFFDHR